MFDVTNREEGGPHFDLVDGIADRAHLKTGPYLHMNSTVAGILKRDYGVTARSKVCLQELHSELLVRVHKQFSHTRNRWQKSCRSRHS